MLNRKSLERALALYADYRDETVARRLALFGPALLRAADAAAEIPTVMPQWSEEDVEAARQGKTTLLSRSAPVIEEAPFLAVLQSIADVLIAELKPEGDLLAACRGVDWTLFTKPELLETAAHDPMAYLAAAEEAAGESDVLDLIILPVLGFALRAFLDSAADEASRRIEAVKTDTTHHNRPLSCPVCGAPAAIAAVVDTPRNGSVKKLYCTCCGGHWLFERIRCAQCGTMAVSDLSYEHEENDASHRLHVCSACHEAMPTVFAGDEMSFNPDVEQIVMTGLECAYEAASAEK